MLCLVTCFVGVTTLVYTDTRGVSLSPSARRGYEVWHEQNCQSCHQIYGFGGFLGADLTNVASRLGARLESRVSFVVDQGPGQMPAFELSKEDTAAVSEFFRELDRTGTGQARTPGVGIDVYTAFRSTVNQRLAGGAPAAAQRGWATFRQRPCMGCHIPFASAPGGAPDLSQAASRLSPQALDRILTDGRPPNMPRPQPPVTTRERGDVIAFLVWLNQVREPLRAGVESQTSPPAFSWAAVPWWEYQR